MPIEPDDLERFLEPSYVEGLEARSMEELRQSRAELQEAEGVLSYVRRLVQGRLDIVAAERAHRAEVRSGAGDQTSPEGASVLAPLVDRLPSILADSGQRGGIGVGRLPMQLDPGAQAAGLVAELDAEVDPAKLTALTSVADAELLELTDQLAAIERRVSDNRRQLHERIDALQAELVRRYRTGEANVDSLLR